MAEATVPGSGRVGLAETLPAPGLRDYAELTAIDREHYIVSGELARGGMGRILAARDRRLGRPVAIKELLGDDEDLRMRFEREARITARLQHPAIVNVLEAGTWPNGEPFYVMRLVVGESLEKAVAKCATLRERLALLPNVIAAVDALAYAHSLRIIHRDLKPHNVLVGEFGETVVIDWGLAKDLGEIESPRVGMSGTETVAGSVMGTPAYMPIEQAEGGQVTERADVYALGAMLYHLLSGAAPYAGGSSAEIIAAVVSGPPPPLASRVDGVPSDLLAIVDKAMAYKAEDRYANASELAVDLKKFQTGQLVGAHAYTSWQLVRRWIGKRRTAVAVAAIAVVLLGIVGAFSVRRILREQARTELSRNEAEDLSGFMLTNLHDKLQPLGKLDLLDDVGKKVVGYYDRRGDDLSDAELRNRALAQRNQGDVLSNHGRTGEALKMFRASLATTQALADALPDDSDRERDLRFSRLQVAQALGARQDARGALAMAREVQALDKRMATRHPDDIEWAWYVVLSHDQAGIRARIAGHLDEAAQEFTAMCADLDRLLRHGADGRPDLLGEYGRLGPPEWIWRSNMATCHQRLGSLMLALGDAAQAQFLVQLSQVQFEQVFTEDPSNPLSKSNVATAHAQLATVYRKLGDTSRAVAEIRVELRLNEELAVADPTNATRRNSVAGTHSALGDVLLDQGDSDGARAQYSAAIEVLTALTARDATNLTRMNALALAHQALGDVYLRRAEMAEADREYQAAMKILSSVSSVTSDDIDTLENVSIVHERIGNLKKARGDYDGAAEAYTAEISESEVIAARDPMNAERKRGLGISHDKLGRLYVEWHHAAKALEQFKLYASLVDPLAASDPSNATWAMEMAWSRMHLAIAKRQLRDSAGALDDLKLADETFARLLRLDPTNTVLQGSLAGVEEEAGETLAETNDLPAAAIKFRAALELSTRMQQNEPENMDLKGNAVRTHQRLANVLFRIGSPDAESESRTVVQLCMQQVGKGIQAPTAITCEQTRVFLAQTLVSVKKVDEASSLLRRVVAEQGRVLAQTPSDDEANSLLGSAELILAQIADTRGDETGSYDYYRQYQLSITASAERKPDDRITTLSRLWADSKVNEKLRLRHEFGAALQLARQDTELVEKLRAATPDDPDLGQFEGQFIEDLGDDLLGLGRTEEATSEYQRLVTLGKRAVAAGDKSAPAALNIAEADERLGDALAVTNSKAARAAYEEGVAMAHDAQAKDPKVPGLTERLASIQKKLAKLRPN